MFEEVRRIKMSGKEEIQQRLESVLQPSLYKKNIQIKKKKVYTGKNQKKIFFSPIGQADSVPSMAVIPYNERTSPASVGGLPPYFPYHELL